MKEKSVFLLAYIPYTSVPYTETSLVMTVRISFFSPFNHTLLLCLPSLKVVSERFCATTDCLNRTNHRVETQSKIIY